MMRPRIPKFFRARPKLDYTNILRELLTAKPDCTISCVIPAWNEAGRITHVLNIVKAFPEFSEIIIVDDGSTDTTYQEIQKFLARYDTTKRFKVIRHTKNSGKTAAVLTGVHAAMGKLIALVDADLWNLVPEDLARMLYPVVNGQYSMTILDRASDRKGIIGVGHSFVARLLGGERAFWKQDFMQMSIPKNGGYLLEIIMNRYYVDRKLPVITLYCPNLSSYHQFSKFSFPRAMSRYLKITWVLLKHGGVQSFYEQFKNIEEDRMGRAYRYYQKTRFKKAAVTGLVIGGATLSIGTFLFLHFLGMKNKVLKPVLHSADLPHQD